ncbi:MAG: helix-turn-helix transcriptional regulator [Trueperaceae bacterium]
MSSGNKPRGDEPTGTEGTPEADQGGSAAPRGIDHDKPLYVISVAAELVDMHPQTLRLYERKGLIEPSRSAGKTRLYSQRNIEQLREIRRLTQELGVNLAGVEEIIRLRSRLDQLQNSMEGRISNLQSQLRDHLDSLRNRQLPAPADEDPDASWEHEDDADDSPSS